MKCPYDGTECDAGPDCNERIGCWYLRTLRPETPAISLALRLTMRTSVAMASPKPAPTATPLMPPTTGWSHRLRIESRNCPT